MILANAFCIVLFVGEWPRRGCPQAGGADVAWQGRMAEVACPSPG